MTNTYTVVHLPVTWRVRLTGRVFGVVFAAGMCAATVGSVIGLVQGEGLDLVPGLVIFPVMALLAWKASVSSRLTLTSTDVIVRNPFGVTRIPLREVIYARAGYGGVDIMRADRSRVGAWAVQKTNLATWFRWHTRADDVVEAIQAAAHEAGAPAPPDRCVHPPSLRESLHRQRHHYSKGFHPRHAEVPSAVTDPFSSPDPPDR